MNRTDRLPGCSGGGVEPGTGLHLRREGTHTCTPTICTVCLGSGVLHACEGGDRRSIAVIRRHVLAAHQQQGTSERQANNLCKQSPSPCDRPGTPRYHDVRHLTTKSNRPCDGHNEPARSEAPAES